MMSRARETVGRMDKAVAEYERLRAEIAAMPPKPFVGDPFKGFDAPEPTFKALDRRPTAGEVEEKRAIIDLILAEYGLEWKYIGADGPDPGEYVGYRVEIHPVSGWIDIGTADDVCGCFPFGTSYTEIRAWCRVKEAELLASIPY